jgi:[acyl-carrier-protein] S-malonyltransferase
MGIAVLFPGQGSQTVGMGADVFSAHPDLLGTVADETLGWSLREMCLAGPEDELTRTEHAQPAIFGVSYALWVSFREAFDGDVVGAAGHSLGEYTALCAAGALGYVEALHTVTHRGQVMARAASEEPSGMAALIGADAELASDVVSKNEAEGGRLQVANINAPGQVVVAGASDDISWLAERARDLGVRRAIPLKVAGAFHSSFMKSAAADLREALRILDFRTPQFPVWSNTTARPHEAARIVATLVDQVVSPVRFQESLENMADAGIDTFVHIGPGDVTAGMARRTVDDASVHVISSLDDIPGVVESLCTMA